MNSVIKDSDAWIMVMEEHNASLSRNISLIFNRIATYACCACLAHPLSYLNYYLQIKYCIIKSSSVLQVNKCYVRNARWGFWLIGINYIRGFTLRRNILILIYTFNFIIANNNTLKMQQISCTISTLKNTKQNFVLLTISSC